MLFIKDTGSFDYLDGVGYEVNNMELKARFLKLHNEAVVKLIGMSRLDFFHVNKFVLYGIPVGLKLHHSSQASLLMSKTDEYEVQLQL